MKEIKVDRIEYVDVAKGIGAFLVILGHVTENGLFQAIIYAFHMPLFFVLSGITFRLKDGESILKFLNNKFKNILIPYLIFSNLVFIDNIIRSYLDGDNMRKKVINRLLGIFLCWKGNNI